MSLWHFGFLFDLRYLLVLLHLPVPSHSRNPFFQFHCCPKTLQNLYLSSRPIIIVTITATIHFLSILTHSFLTYTMQNIWSLLLNIGLYVFFEILVLVWQLFLILYIFCNFCCYRVNSIPFSLRSKAHIIMKAIFSK